jgi:predicted nucleic acid-binding protein
LNGDEYADALESASQRGIVGGAVYDTLLAHCALKAEADVIYSWNRRHYALCGPEVMRRLRAPGYR